MKLFLKVDFMLILLMSALLLLFVAASISKIGLQVFQGGVAFLAIAQLILYFPKTRRVVLIFGAFQFFLMGLFLFFVILMPSSPDSTAVQVFNLPTWILISFGVALFLVCFSISSKLLSFANTLKKTAG